MAHPSTRPALLRPAPLRPGDVVAVVAPSAPVDPVRLERGVALLESWGLRVRIGEHVLARAHDGMLAGDDAQRAADLHRAWTDPEVTAVLAARGGYGATRLLPLLDWGALSAAGPRWLVGSSDITALHAAVAGRLGLQTLHGPMPASQLLAGDEPDEHSAHCLHAALFGASGAFGWTCGDLGRSRPGASGRATGPLTGGNLALLCALAGTPDLPASAGHVVLLEDVDEPPYRIDRMLTQLRAAGWFDDVLGVVLGSFVRCGDPKVLDRVLDDRLGDLGVPVVGDVPVGHGHPQESLVLGGEVTVDAADASVSWGLRPSPPSPTAPSAASSAPDSRRSSST